MRLSARFLMAAALFHAYPVTAQAWTAVGPPGNPSVTALLVDPRAPTTLYAGTTQTGIFVTRDAGLTWSAANTGLTSLEVTSLAFLQLSTPGAAPLFYAGTIGAGVFRSNDEGSTWVPVNDGLSSLRVWSLAVAPAAATVYAGTDEGVFKSTDDVKSWTPVNSGLPNWHIVSLAVDWSNPSILYAATGRPPNGSLFRTTDGGANWAAVALPDRFDRVFRAVAVDPFFSETVYAGFWYGYPPISRFQIGGLMKSVDGGRSWTDVSPGLGSRSYCAPIWSIAGDPTAPGHIYASTSSSFAEFGGVLITNDFGASWVVRNDSLSSLARVLTVAPTSPSTVYAGTWNGVVRATSDVKGSCAPDATTLCLQSDRFRVSVGWSVPAQGQTELGQARPIVPNTGAFWFFDPTNLELVVKVLDGRSINGHFWVFYGSLTNVAFTLTVTDTETGAVKTYTNRQGQLASVADTSAF
ncbi:MAG: WD40/YVTN/BNR-like repeat-containing protein [Thermoanaerobaculia bacterium]